MIGSTSTAPVLPQLDASVSSFEKLRFNDFALDDNTKSSQSLQSQDAHNVPQTFGNQYPPTSALDPTPPQPPSLEFQSQHAEQVQSFYQISPSLNTTDSLSLNYLIQSSIASSEGFCILSETEVQALKNEQQRLASRKNELRHKLNLETKMKDAATSLSKFHLKPHDQNSSPPLNTRKLIFSGKKRLSKQALEEADISDRRINQINSDLTKIGEELNTCEINLLRHSVALLGLSHNGSGSSWAMSYSNTPGNNTQKYPQQSDNVGQGTAVQINSSHNNVALFQATPRMNRLSRSSFSTDSRHSTSKDQESLINLEGLDQLILMTSNALSSPTTSLGPTPSPKAKIKHLEDLTKILVRQHTSLRTELEQKDTQIMELRNKIEEVLLDLDENSSLRNATDAPIHQFTDLLGKSVDSIKAKQASDRENLLRMINNQNSSQHTAEDQSNDKSKLQKQLQALQESYESNRAVLEKLELENIDLRNDFKTLRFTSESEIDKLGLEVGTNIERVEEWKERSAATRDELEAVIKSLEDVTRQTVEFESERAKLEETIIHLQNKVFQMSGENAEKRMSMVTLPRSPALGQGESQVSISEGKLLTVSNQPKAMMSNKSDLVPALPAAGEKSGSVGPEEVLQHQPLPPQQQQQPPISVSLLQQEFRRILQDVNYKHANELRKEQFETKKAQRLLRSYKAHSLASGGRNSMVGIGFGGKGLSIPRSVDSTKPSVSNMGVMGTSTQGSTPLTSIAMIV